MHDRSAEVRLKVRMKIVKQVAIYIRARSKVGDTSVKYEREENSFVLTDYRPIADPVVTERFETRPSLLTRNVT